MELYELLNFVGEVFSKLNIPYIITGSMASIAYGEPRLTNNIDIVADIRESQIPDLRKYFPSEDFYSDEEAILWAIRNHGQFNIIHPTSGLKVDIFIKHNNKFDQSRFQRSKRVSTSEGYEAYFATEEDIIIKKMEYYRVGGSEKHLRDITGILKVSGDKIDREYIEYWAKEFGVMKIWVAIQDRIKGKLKN